MNDSDWTEYYRRLALRDERRAEVRRAVGFHDDHPGRGVPQVDRYSGRTPLDERSRTREQYLRDEAAEDEPTWRDEVASFDEIREAS